MWMVTSGILAVALIAVFVIMVQRLNALKRELESTKELLNMRDAQLREAKHLDGLTRALTARSVREKADGEIHRAIRYGMALSVIVFDIDRLKQINDTQGRAMGDRVLQLFANTMLRGLRETDWFGRWEEDNFIAVLPETHLETAIEAANRLKDLLEEALLGFKDEGGMVFSVSMGIAQFSGQHETFKDLYQAAEKALIKGKVDGKGAIGY